MSGRRYKAGKNSYWQFLMSERKAKPHLSQEDLQVHVAKMWRRGGFDSYGRPLELLLTREAQEQAETSKMQEEIRGWVEDGARSGKLAQCQFYIIQANVFCLTDEKGVVPAEISLARVSLANGVEEVYHQLIHPGPLPLGYRADCIYNASKTHKIPLDLAGANQNYSSILAGITSFVGTSASGEAPLVYVLPKFRLQTQRVVNWLQEKAGQVSNNNLVFNLFSLPCLLFHLARVGKELPGCVYVPTENLAEVQLDRDVFLYTVGMACVWHQEQDETVHCSAALVRRWAFILCHICCPRHELELLPGRHKPFPKPPYSYSRGLSSGSSVSASSCRREGRRRKSAAPEMWLPNNWGHTDPDALVLSINEEEEKVGDNEEEEERETSCPLADHPFLSLASTTTADQVAPSRDSILVIPPLCFSDRDEVPSIATSINDDHLSLATIDTLEEQDLLADFAEDHVSINTSMSENNLELQMSLASSKVEEEEDWVWEGLSQWSIDPTDQ